MDSVSVSSSCSIAHGIKFVIMFHLSVYMFRVLFREAMLSNLSVTEFFKTLHMTWPRPVSFPFSNYVGRYPMYRMCPGDNATHSSQM